MGIFDIFKNKGNNPPPRNERFELATLYKEYIVMFIRMQLQGNYSPIAAYQNKEGELIGFLYLADNPSYEYSVQQAIDKMEETFEEKLKNDEILSYTIYYHSQYQQDDNHTIALEGEEFKAISIKYKFEGKTGFLALQYSFQDKEITYQGIDGFDQEQNQSIMGAKITDKDYFQERVSIETPVYENEIGLHIKTMNTGQVGTIWSGVFGFETYREKNGHQRLSQQIPLIVSEPIRYENDGVEVHEKWYHDKIGFRVISKGKHIMTLAPFIKTKRTFPILNKQVGQWENTLNLEATIAGAGRETFGLSYYANDYAMRAADYLSKKAHTMNISGLIYVLDKSGDLNEGKNSETQFSPDFCGYFPNKDLAHFGCYDFVGTLLAHEAVSFLGIEGYIITVKLINNDADPDFFTIDAFVNTENMRISTLENGMQITGLVQLLGEIHG